ncbi:ABC transporter substrate-binding protein [Cuneatibacter caecimuris]|uniref:ABC-type transport system substrate-binding protein n=1 Tax=Cuneatibacter caecimuris TaxID=1796618 RepID=A0A4Q7PN97_9FIRM|nr:ABC transporter substrate-binding protein [Cuneatibacter caecimuris]RZT02344.1 ABC-type transport system substrate-binding protein [Cuneatibacter caecimuris]
MKKSMKKLLALGLSGAMVLSLAACGSDDKGTTAAPGPSGDEPTTTAPGGDEKVGAGDTLVVGSTELNGVFTPFFYNSNYDANVIGAAIESICELDANNEMVPNLGEVTQEEVEEDGKTYVNYTIKLKDGIKFSDGEPMTIDDVIFTYKVYCDPTYDGIATFRNAVKIVGMNEYFYDTPDYEGKVKEAGEKAAADIEDEAKFKAFLKESNLDGWWDGELPGDLDGEGMTWADYLKGEGFDPTGIENDADAMLDMLVDCEFQNYRDGYVDAATAYFNQQYLDEFIKGNLEDGVDVKDISGITRVDDLTCVVKVEGVDISAARNLGLNSVVPEHIYGKDYVKGDLSGVKKLNDTPIGSGPFIFESFENNVVTFKRNENYWGGCPKVEYLKFQVVDEEQKKDSVLNGEIDITDPSASKEIVEELDALGANYSLVPFAGYGYIAISAKNVPDQKVREGLMHLMTRNQAIKTYYGDVAHVIERPMCPVLAEYPTDAEEYWGYDPDKAVECFKEAGYETVDGKLMKDGKQLTINVGIGSAATHPSTPVLTQMKEDMDKLGAVLNIQDMDFNLLSDAVDGDSLDMWVMAWGNSTDCDLRQIFGSEYTKAGGSNRTWVQDPEIDALMEEVVNTLDLEKRKELVAKELDMIMSWATYMPVYQRSDMLLYSDAVNMDSIPETSTFYSYLNELEKVELNH